LAAPRFAPVDALLISDPPWPGFFGVLFIGELLAAENLPRPSFNGVDGRRFRTKEIANGVPADG
jgi:hypothetical protein